jgi:hypothetical protein
MPLPDSVTACRGQNRTLLQSPRCSAILAQAPDRLFLRQKVASVPIMGAPARAAATLIEHTPITPLNQHEISVLVLRGEEYLKAGQIADARSVLQRAADAHDARGR